MDPIGTAPYFISLTAGRSPAGRRLAAIQAAAAAGILVAGFALFGRLLLDYLGVSVEALTIAGGFLLLLLGLQMFRGQEMEHGATTNIAMVPLATPLLAGPGAIAAIMVLSGRNPAVIDRLSVIAGVAAVVLVIAIGLLLADLLARLLRPPAISLLTQVLALLLSALAVQLIVEAVTSLVRHGL
ncbi:MAG: antibiotic resistance protein MarC [Candidatus Dormiibacter spiritus]|nr:MAG: antibiotic resistance protein MarC [Candidatus Dormibacteraeota bacterium]